MGLARRRRESATAPRLEGESGLVGPASNSPRPVLPHISVPAGRRFQFAGCRAKPDGQQVFVGIANALQSIGHDRPTTMRHIIDGHRRHDVDKVSTSMRIGRLGTGQDSDPAGGNQDGQPDANQCGGQLDSGKVNLAQGASSTNRRGIHTVRGRSGTSRDAKVFLWMSAASPQFGRRSRIDYGSTANWDDPVACAVCIGHRDQVRSTVCNGRTLERFIDSRRCNRLARRHRSERASRMTRLRLTETIISTDRNSAMFKKEDHDDAETLLEPIHDSLGKFFLRLTVGGLMLFHGVAKLRGGIEGIEGMVTGAGLPAALAYGVYIGEVVVPVLIILGLWTRLSALVMAFNMVVAIGLAHAGDLFSIGEHGEWAIEAAAFYLFTSLCITLLGPGAYAVGRKTGLFA